MRQLFHAVFLLVVAAVIVAGGCAGQEFGSNTDPVTPGEGGVPTGGNNTDGGMMGNPDMTCAPVRRCSSAPDKGEGQVIECGSAPNGCGDTLQCGACPVGQKCQSGKCLKQAFCGNG